MDKEIILKEIKQEAIENHVPIIEDDSLEYIENILKETKPNKILEVGDILLYIFQNIFMVKMQKLKLWR